MNLTIVVVINMRKKYLGTVMNVRPRISQLTLRTRKPAAIAIVRYSPLCNSRGPVDNLRWAHLWQTGQGQVLTWR